VTALQTTDPSSRQRGLRTTIIKQLADKRKGKIWTWALKEVPTSRQIDLLAVGRFNNYNETMKLVSPVQLLDRELQPFR
jgi:hypothetical protein